MLSKYFHFDIVKLEWIGVFIVKYVKKFYILSGVFVLMIGLTGCLNKSTPEENIYETLEEVASIEKDFEKQQKPLQKLEEEDNELYGKIIKLGMKEMDEIQSLSNDAIKGIEKRQELMEKEKASIDKAKERFKDFDEQIEELEDASLQTEAKSLKDIMTSRFDEYDQLYKYYTKSLTQENELYTLFTKEDVTKEELEEKIKSINETYLSLMNSNQTFNDLTNEYNEKKIAFYKSAKLDVDSDQEKSHPE